MSKRARKRLRRSYLVTTNWTPVITNATKFRTPLEAAAIAFQYDGYVVRYNGDNRSWSQLSDRELNEDFG